MWRVGMIINTCVILRLLFSASSFELGWKWGFSIGWHGMCLNYHLSALLDKCQKGVKELRYTTCLCTNEAVNILKDADAPRQGIDGLVDTRRINARLAEESQCYGQQHCRNVRRENSHLMGLRRFCLCTNCVVHRLRDFPGRLSAAMLCYAVFWVVNYVINST